MPTGFMTNAIKLAETLRKDCSGDHRHVVLIGGGRAKRAEVYPGELCKQIIFGLRDQMIHDGRLGEGMIGAVDRIDEAPSVKIDARIYDGVEFYDDVSGEKLPLKETIAARLKEMEDVAYSFKGVTKAYAIQAGRELRVMVESEKISDDHAAKLSFEISQKIQTDMTYPGQVKVTVIRETRAVNIAS